MTGKKKGDLKQNKCYNDISHLTAEANTIINILIS